MSEGDHPDVEGGIRDYLQADSGVKAIVGTRGVFFGIPDGPSWPLVVIRRVGGSEDSSEAAIDLALLQIDCWGRLFNDTDPTKSAHGDKAQTEALRRAVRKALWQIRGITRLNSSVVAFGAFVESDPFVPDPNNDRPRYAITARVTARAA